MSQSKSRSAQIGQSLMFLLLLPIYILTIPLLVSYYLYTSLLEWLFTFTKHGKAGFFPLDIYPWTSRLQDNWLKIRSELNGVLANLDAVPNFQDLMPAQRALTQDDKWKTLVFSVMGRRVEENARACPETAKLIESIPGVRHAMFSVLKPDKHIAPHRGPYGGMLNCHLALRVPEPREQCALRVANETRHWEEGRMMVFNDRNEHEAWNRSNEVRVVLFMYVIRPLPFPLSAMNRVAIWLSQYVFGAAKIRKAAREASRNGERPQASAAAHY